ncbi:hypothetical protein D3C75_849380 [compost metagenome]
MLIDKINRLQSILGRCALSGWKSSRITVAHPVLFLIHLKTAFAVRVNLRTVFFRNVSGAPRIKKEIALHLLNRIHAKRHFNFNHRYLRFRHIIIAIHFFVIRQVAAEIDMLLHILHRQIGLGRFIHDIAPGTEEDSMCFGIIFDIVNPNPVYTLPFKQRIRRQLHYALQQGYGNACAER